VSYCVILCLLVGRVWVCCVVDLLLFLSGFCLSGGYGLRGTHAGLSQLVSDWSTVALFFFGCVCNLALCFVFSLLLCLDTSLLFCGCECGCCGMWTVLLLLVFDLWGSLCCFLFLFV